MHLLCLHDHLTGTRVECADLPFRETLLPGERREIGDAAGPLALQRCGRLRRLCLERLDFADARRELECKPTQLRPAVAGIGRGLSTLPGAPLELVQPRDGVVERGRAEQHSDRVGLSFFVERPEPGAQDPLRRLEVPLDHGDLAPDPLLVGPERLCAALEHGQRALGPGKARIKGKEAEKSAVGAGREGRLPLAEPFWGRAVGSRQENPE